MQLCGASSLSILFLQGCLAVCSHRSIVEYPLIIPVKRGIDHRGSKLVSRYPRVFNYIPHGRFGVNDEPWSCNERLPATSVLLLNSKDFAVKIGLRINISNEVLHTTQDLLAYPNFPHVPEEEQRVAL